MNKAVNPKARRKNPFLLTLLMRETGERSLNVESVLTTPGLLQVKSPCAGTLGSSIAWAFFSAALRIPVSSPKCIVQVASQSAIATRRCRTSSTAAASSRVGTQPMYKRSLTRLYLMSSYSFRSVHQLLTTTVQNSIAALDHLHN